MENSRDVVMADGSVQTFSARQRMKKTLNPESRSVTFLFDNGQTTTYTVPEALVNHAAAHGLSQRLGDVAASKGKELSTEDIQQLIAENYANSLGAEVPTWAAARESNGLAGAGLLARALVQKTGKSLEQVTAFLATKSKAEKAAFMRVPEIAAIIDSLRPVRAEVDVEDLLSGL